MIGRIVAIYRPRTRSVLLASGDYSIEVEVDRVLRLAASLRKVAAMIRPQSALRIHNGTGSLMVQAAELPDLCDALDAAFAIPAHAAALAAEPIGG